jgi:hypothetical protein
MKKQLLILLFMVSAIASAQTNLLGQSGFDSVTIPNDCNGGVNYDGSCNNGCPEVRQNAVPGGSTWFRCGNKLDVVDDGSASANYYLRLLDGGSTPARQLVEDLDVSGVYKVSIKVNKTATNTLRPITLLFKQFDNTNADNVSGWSEVTSNPNVTVTDATVTILPEAFSSGSFTTFEFYFTPTQADVILQIASAKEGGAGSGKDTYIDDVTMVLDPTAGVEDLKQFNLSYYPNPAKGELYVSALENIQGVELVNLLGQNVLSKKMNSKKATLDISHLKNGIYIMKLSINGAVGTYKIIKE